MVFHYLSPNNVNRSTAFAKQRTPTPQLANRYLNPEIQDSCKALVLHPLHPPRRLLRTSLILITPIFLFPLLLRRHPTRTRCPLRDRRIRPARPLRIQRRRSISPSLIPSKATSCPRIRRRSGVEWIFDTLLIRTTWWRRWVLWLLLGGRGGIVVVGSIVEAAWRTRIVTVSSVGAGGWCGCVVVRVCGVAAWCRHVDHDRLCANGLLGLCWSG